MATREEVKDPHASFFIDLVHPDELRPQIIADWLSHSEKDIPDVRSLIDMNAISKIPQLAETLLNTPNHLERIPFSQSKPREIRYAVI